MPETTAYFDTVSAARSIQHFSDNEQGSLEGTQTISLETMLDTQEQGILTYINDNFGDFIQQLRLLKREDQDLLLSYYLLGKTQNCLAPVFSLTQTVVSSRLRLAVRTLCAYMTLGHPITAAKLLEPFRRAGVEDNIPGLPLSQAVEEFVRCQSFSNIANVHDIHRPDIRRGISRAAKTLVASEDQLLQAIGAYLTNLIDKVSPIGRGLSKRQSQKLGSTFRTDPDIVGEFCISVDSPDFEACFTSRANR